MSNQYDQCKHEDIPEDDSKDAHQQELECNCKYTVTEYCCECQTTYCREHSKVNHSYEGTTDHDRIPINEFKAAVRALDQKADLIEDFKVDWESNNILYVSPNTKKIEKGLKWLNTGIKDNEPFLLASFAGPTGAGKSSLIRYIADGKDIPVSSNSQTVAASSDINCYNGKLSNNSKFLIFDSEGKGADVINQAIINTQLASDHIGLEYRRPFIDTCYPRLLYLFSDVFIYVFNQSAQQSQNVISELLSFAEESAAASINQLTKPHLIVVYNRSTNIASYDVKEASEMIFPEHSDNKALNELRTYYQTLNAIFIPPGNSVHPKTGEIHWYPRSYLEQMNKFKDLLHSRLESAHRLKTSKNINCSRPLTMAYISKAISILNESPHGAIDIYKMTRSMEGVNSYIYEYFECIFNQNIELNKMTPVAAFDSAYVTIQKRVVDIIYVHCKRNGIIPPTKGNSLPQPLIEIFEKAYQSITGFQPCGAFHPQHKDVQCEILKNRHDNTKDHKSTKTIKKPRSFLFLNFGEKTVSESIKWASAGCVTKPLTTLLEYAIENLPESHLDDNNTLENRKTLLFNQHLAKTSNVCYGCLLSHPTQPRKCGHMFCVECCQESPHQCPVCHIDSPWASSDIPKFAGTRILSIEGIGGVRGMAQTIIIQKLEYLLFGIPIRKLFDLIAGSGSGGIIALGITGNDGNSGRMTEFYNAMKSIQTYPLGTVRGIKTLTKLLYRAIFKRDSFNRILSYHISPNDSNKSLLGHVTPGNAHVAVAATTTYTGSVKKALFTSYHLPGKASGDAEIVNSTTVLEAALATSATEGYIEAYTINGISYTDGSSVALSPCKIAFEESQRLFSNRPFNLSFDRKCDLITTITTGKWANASNQTRDDTINSGSGIICAISESITKWNELKEDLNGTTTSFVRIDPMFSDDYQYDDMLKVDAIKSDADRYCDKNSELIDLANRILASQFYLDENVTPLDDSITFTIKCRLSLSDYQETYLKKMMNDKGTSAFTITGKGFNQDNLVFKTPPKVSSFEPFIQSFTINKVQRDKLDSIDIKCNLLIEGSNESRTYSISGLPLKFDQVIK